MNCSIRLNWLRLGLGAVVCSVGCAINQSPPAGIPLAPPSTAPVAVLAAPPRMTLPQFLGIDTVFHGAAVAMRQTRLHLSQRWPVLQPPTKRAQLALGDPANLASPSPAVATAAAIQQAEADAPAKVQALAYLATLGCQSNSQVEESILAGMDDVSDAVRIAAVQAVLDSGRDCHQCTNQCTGCCTIAIRQKLMQLAYQQNEHACYCEANSQVRRLARLVLCKCGCTYIEPAIPSETPAPEVIDMLAIPPTVEL